MRNLRKPNAPQIRKTGSNTVEPLFRGRLIALRGAVGIMCVLLPIGFLTNDPTVGVCAMLSLVWIVTTLQRWRGTLKNPGSDIWQPQTASNTCELRLLNET